MNLRLPFLVFVVLLLLYGCSKKPSMEPVKIHKGSRVVLIGNNLGSRMMEYGDFDTELHTRFPDSLLYIRNICNPGNTAGFRPHPSRNSPWAFDGAEAFNPEYDINTGSEGHFPTEDAWLQTLKPDVIIGFFGYSESFKGAEGVDNSKGEIAAFIDHTKKQDYNGGKGITLVLVSPCSFKHLSDKYDLRNGEATNTNIKMYAYAMADIDIAKNVPFSDVFSVSKNWYNNTPKPLTIEGSQLT